MSYIFMSKITNDARERIQLPTSVVHSLPFPDAQVMEEKSFISLMI